MQARTRALSIFLLFFLFVSFFPFLFVSSRPQPLSTMSAPPPSVHKAEQQQRRSEQSQATQLEDAPAAAITFTRGATVARRLPALSLSVVSLLAAVQSADGPRVRALLHLAEPAPNDNDTSATAAAAAAAVTPASSSPPADPNACDADGSSALHWAAWVKSRSCFSALLQAGGDPTRCNSRGESVLEWALRGGDLPLLAALLIRPDARAAVHSRNAFGGQPMHIAAEEGAVAAMAALAIMGAEMDARDARGKTPLMCAAHRNRPAVRQTSRHTAGHTIRAGPGRAEIAAHVIKRINIGRSPNECAMLCVHTNWLSLRPSNGCCATVPPPLCATTSRRRPCTTRQWAATNLLARRFSDRARRHS